MRLHEAYVVVNEGLSPLAVSYGTNTGRNDEVFAKQGAAHYTFFLKDGQGYVVGAIVNRNRMDITFASNQTDDPLSNRIGDYSDNRTPTTDALRVFGGVIYIVTQLVKRIGPDIISFKPKDAKLGGIYRRAVISPSIARLFDDLGYEYAGEHKGEILLKRVV